MKRHERLAVAIEEQRQLIAALERERDGGLDKQLNELWDQIHQMQARAGQLEKRRGLLLLAIQNANDELQNLLSQRRVEETPDLKKLLRMKEQFDKLKREAGEAGIDLDTLANPE